MSWSRIKIEIDSKGKVTLVTANCGALKLVKESQF